MIIDTSLSGNICQVLVKNEAGKRPGGLAIFGLPMPTWLGHVLASLFLHQDLDISRV